MVTDEIYERFLGKDRYFKHGITHAAHPVGCAVALASIDMILDEKLAENAAQVGAYLKNGLETLISCRPQIGDVRGRGLMIAIELLEDRETRQPLNSNDFSDIINDIYLRGLMVSRPGSCVQLMPPLITSKSLADEMVRIINQALDTHLANKLRQKFRLFKEYTFSKIRP